MSRLSDCFQARHDARKKVLITYAMAGYPNKAGTVNMINGMIEGGSDIVEIGFPFSDPLADGKLIQKASTIALGHKMNLDAYFKIVSYYGEFFGIFFANFTACAIACDDSSAGIIPSVFVKSKNAFTASLSVAAAYKTLPVSFKLACSGPTPG